MQTHRDDDFDPGQFMEQLGRRAKIAKKAKTARITVGDAGEPVLDEWDAYTVHVVQRPPDPQGILRISVGGGEFMPVDLNYCVFRGDRTQCAFLLEKAAKALREGQSTKEASDG